MSKVKKIFILGLLFGLMGQGKQIYAVEDEIQVYTDSMNEPGKYGVELHSSHVTRGPKKPSYEGETPSNHVTQITPEFAYGLTKNFEAGLYFPPMALSPDGSIYENGIRIRLKFIGDKKPNSKMFWGLNTEFGYSTKRVSETNWNLELRPIVGYKNEHWLVSFNPNLATPVSGKNHTPEFEPCLKVGYSVKQGIMLGFEDYAGFGQINQMTNVRKSENLFYLAADISKGNLNMNFAVGYGLSNTNERGVIKMIITVPL